MGARPLQERLKHRHHQQGHGHYHRQPHGDHRHHHDHMVRVGLLFYGSQTILCDIATKTQAQ